MRYALLLAALLLPLSVQAKSPPLEPLPYIPPPPGMAADADLEPQITIRRKDDSRIEEFRIKGRLYMIKITPAHGKPYFLIDHKGDGQMTRHDDVTPTLSVPLWVIHTF
ncbi:MAG: DUF2782 domain-containing protein [Betaproteobacteria bacterium]|nr:DUF2782 domain-containing protein [Betaproteobacteria bacterium]